MAIIIFFIYYLVVTDLNIIMKQKCCDTNTGPASTYMEQEISSHNMPPLCGNVIE
jgi:hypothetical protein